MKFISKMYVSSDDLPPQIVIVWDLIKVGVSCVNLNFVQKRLRKSEEDEMARLIGKDIIENLEVSLALQINAVGT